jgi:preprotein translocase subunit SecG
MTAVILVIHLIIAVAMVGVVLLQKSEGGGLGMGGGGMSGFMTGRSTANLLTRTTAILAACFMLTSITLGLLAATQRAPQSIVGPTPSTAPAAPAAPAQPAAPSVPLAK